MKIKTLLCHCQRLSDSLKDADMNTLPFEVESALNMDYAIVHPDLCGPGGKEILADVLRAAEDDPDTYIIVGGCAPEVQRKLFKKTLAAEGFDEARFVPVDIRGTTNQGILERLREKVEALVKPQKKQH
jgi:heterodisulfide reductase subunit A-like polyferredoxin